MRSPPRCCGEDGDGENTTVNIVDTNDSVLFDQNTALLISNPVVPNVAAYTNIDIIVSPPGTLRAIQAAAACLTDAPS